MDLPTVKASVKAWEKAFKAQHKRDPTKEDIKRDPSGIGEFLGDRNSS
jgi:thiamine biosynthesis lipoprotein ApbE